jgi:hypothetical protein
MCTVNCEKLAQCDTDRETYGSSYSQNVRTAKNEWAYDMSIDPATFLSI